MELFKDFIDGTSNLLPYDGIVNYYGKILETGHANDYLEQLLKEVAWRHDEAIVYGKHITTRRKVAWYGDIAFEYTYSKTTKKALPWIPVLAKLKSLVEEKSGDKYNSCLLNLYHTGEEGMAWHSDAERDLKKNAAIASLSFGVERKFSFKHKNTKEKVTIKLEHGSLMVMKGTTQTYWLHRLPPTKTVQQARVNLTFRTINVDSNVLDINLLNSKLP